MSESVILEMVKKNFKDHLILGEEGTSLEAHHIITSGA